MLIDLRIRLFVVMPGRIQIKTILTFCLILFFCGPISARGFKVYSNFPAGNIIVEKIRNDTVWMRPDLRTTKGEWFYWCFAVNNAKNQTLTFVLTIPDLFTVKGAAVSYDSGNNWEWLTGKPVTNGTFTFKFKSNREVRFSMGMPYTQIQFNHFIRPYLKSDLVTLDALTKTKSGREVERLIIRPVNAPAQYKVLITARHHACEMMANYEIEGIIREIMNDEWLKNKVEFCIIPFIDKDGVENGDQGKNRVPRDHNRDYNEISIHESTAALRYWVPGWSEKKLAVCVDLHCPWIKGENNENIYLPGANDLIMAEQEKLFCKLLSSNNSGELKISDKVYFPYGKGWNTSANTTQGYSFKRWSSGLEGVRLSITIEFPYGNNEGQTITQTNSRAFGTDLTKTIKKYLQQL